MSNYRTTRIAAAAALTIMVSTAPVYAGDPSGTWLRDTGTSQIRISRCGNGYCGNIVWLKEPNDANGNPRTDSENPDPSKQNNPLIGTRVILNMVPDGENKWTGQVYKADEGKTFSGYMRILDDDTLELAGCVMGGAICRKGKLHRQ